VAFNFKINKNMSELLTNLSKYILLAKVSNNQYLLCCSNTITKESYPAYCLNDNELMKKKQQFVGTNDIIDIIIDVTKK
jgi:hypothetical protein